MNVLVPFQAVNKHALKTSDTADANGIATSRSMDLGQMRMKLVEYTPGYHTDKLCISGRFLYCVSGEISIKLGNGESYTLREGMGYQVLNNSIGHRAESNSGAVLLVLDSSPESARPQIRKNPWRM